jgi:hypothetical protein
MMWLKHEAGHPQKVGDKVGSPSRLSGIAVLHARVQISSPSCNMGTYKGIFGIC